MYQKKSRKLIKVSHTMSRQIDSRLDRLQYNFVAPAQWLVLLFIVQYPGTYIKPRKEYCHKSTKKRPEKEGALPNASLLRATSFITACTGCGITPLLVPCGWLCSYFEVEIPTLSLKDTTRQLREHAKRKRRNSPFLAILQAASFIAVWTS